MRLVVLTFVGLAGLQAWGNSMDPKQVISCWDGTFAYNQVKISVENDEVHFFVSGNTPGHYSQLVPIKSGFSSVEIRFQLPVGSCMSDPADPTITHCEAEKLTVTGQVQDGLSSPHLTELKYIEVDLRAVHGVAPHGVASGYELFMTSMSGAPLLAVSYLGYLRGGSQGCEISKN